MERANRANHPVRVRATGAVPPLRAAVRQVIVTISPFVPPPVGIGITAVVGARPSSKLRRAEITFVNQGRPPLPVLWIAVLRRRIAETVLVTAVRPVLPVRAIVLHRLVLRDRPGMVVRV